jgi:hypothetical protein
MASLGKFDATQHDTEGGSYDVLPDGIYKLEVSASEVKPTKANNGTILKLTYDVVEPEQFKGRKIFGNINIENANVTAQEIGQKELASLCRACSLSTIDDSEELHFIAFTAKVGMEKAQEGYEPRNQIKRFYFPDQDVPEVSVTAKPANDNRRPAPAAANQNKPANDTRQTNNAGAPATKRPWGK